MFTDLSKISDFIVAPFSVDTEKVLADNPWADKDKGFAERVRNHPDAGGQLLFIRDFEIAELPLDATLHVGALGCYDVYCNGKRVGAIDNGEMVYNEMKPGSIVYSKRTLFDSYSLRPYLREGKNRLLVTVTGGWYTGRIAFGTYKDKPLALIAVLSQKTDDGESLLLKTDAKWLCAQGGQVRFTDIWDGEFQDMRFESDEVLSLPETEIKDAQAACVCAPSVAVTPFIGPFVRLRKELAFAPKSALVWKGTDDNGSDFGKIHILHTPDINAPVSLKATERLIIDLGQNIVGRETLCIKGAAGTTVTVTFAEMKNDSGLLSRGNDGPDGSLYCANYRSAKSKSQYVLSGIEAGDILSPRFTFSGFRYAEIMADGDVDVLSYAFDVIGSDCKETGTLSCSNEEVNQLISNIKWGQRGNYLSIPTDCPQRDERLGWTGDTQVFCRTAMYNANVLSFLKKWMQDARDCQYPCGSFPPVIPWVKIFGENSTAAWSDAGIIVPYTLYLMYGDISVLAENKEAMEKYMDHLASRPNFVGPEPVFLDWLSFEPTVGDYIAMCYYAYDATLMAKIERELADDASAQKYEALYGQIREAFRQKHLDESGQPIQKTQTAYLLALKMGMFEENEKEVAIKALRQKIIDNGYRLSTGFVGTGILCQTLSELGQDDLAYTLLLQTDCPSWLYSVRQGATTIWERWNSYTLENGFGDVNMNSFNHYAYGAVAEWMYRFMVGIEADEHAPGFAHFYLQPRPDMRTKEQIPKGQERITYAKATFESPKGEIYAAWENKECFRYEVRIPEGTRATLILPLLGKEGYLQNNVWHKVETAQTTQISLPAGTYTFEV